MIDHGHIARRRPAGSRRERRKREVRERLYEIALELFETRGFESTSVQEICELADVAKGTFFNYFPSKEHVLVAYHDKLKTELLAVAARQRPAGAEAAVDWLFRAWARRTAARPVLGRLLVRVFFSSDLLLAADAELEGRLAVWLRGHVEAGVASGELRTDLEVERFLELVVAVLSATTIEAVVARPEMDLERELRARNALLFAAARAAAHGGSMVTQERKRR